MLGLSFSIRDLWPAALGFLLLFGILASPAFRQPFEPGHAAASVILALALAALSAIDLQHYRLPDVITLPLAGLGLLVSTLAGHQPIWWSALAALVGFALLAGFGLAYRYIRGRTGLGLGDAKLLAAAGAWVGAEALPTLLLWATGPALLCVLLAYWRGQGMSATTRLPFGPFLATATWLVWLYGPL
jgi:leader peptidase (prepilin peptidase) / N-methyltransferase